MKRIYVDYTWLGSPDELTQFEVNLLPRDRKDLIPGAKVILESDGMPDHIATFVELIDQHRGLFSLVPVVTAAVSHAAPDRDARDRSC